MRSRPIEDFYLAADGDDWVPAIVRAQTAMSKHDTMTITFSSRVYRCASALDIFRKVCLQGELGAGFKVITTAQTTYQYPQLYFYNDTGGITFHYPTVGGTTGTYATDPTADSFRPVIRNLAIIGTNTTGSGAYHGITAHRPFTLENFSISNFPGNGINVYATATSTGSGFGNANSFTIKEGYIYRIGGNGLFFQGADSNAAIISHVSLNDCGRKYSGSTTNTTGITIVADNLAVTGTPTVAASEITAVVASGHNYTAGMYCELVQVDNSVVDVNGDGVVDDEDLVYGLVSGTVSSVTATSITLPYTGGAPASGTYKIRTGLGANTVAGSTASRGEGRVLWATVASHSFVAGQTVRLGSITQVPMSSGDITAVYKTTSTLVGMDCPTKTYAVDGTTSDPDLTGTLADGSGTISLVFAQLYNSSFLQNTFDTLLFGPTGTTNGIQVFDDSNKSTYIGCYSEGSQEQIIVGPSLVIGGNFDQNSSRQKGAGHIYATGSGGVGVTRYVECYPELYADGIVSRIGGQSSNPDSNSFFEWGHSYAYNGSLPFAAKFEQSTSGRNAGYIELVNHTSNGYALMMFPHNGNNRNKKMPVFNSGALFASPQDLTTNVGTQNPQTHPEQFGFLGFNVPTTGYLPLFVGDGKGECINGTANDGSGNVRISTASAHGCAVGDRVLITGVVGTTEANGYWIIEEVSDTTHVDIPATYANAYTTWTATLGSGSFDSATAITTFTTSGASGSLSAGDRICLSGGVANRDLLVKSISGTTLKVRGPADVSAATSANKYSGYLQRVHAIGYGTTYPTGGKWAKGDIIYNTAPAATGVIGWVCTVGGTSGGTWKALTYSAETSLDSGAAVIGQVYNLRCSVTSGAASPTTLLDTTPGLPYAVRVIDVSMFVSTAEGGATLTVEDSDGNALSDAMSLTSVGHVRSAAAAGVTGSVTVAAGKGIRVTRSATTNVAEIMISYVIT